jgi:hypothetical protein
MTEYRHVMQAPKNKKLIFRTVTRGDEAILKKIKSTPGYCATEYGEMLGILPSRVHDVINSTKEGLDLAKNGKIIVAHRGRVPFWARHLGNHHVEARRAGNMLQKQISPRAPKGIGSDVKLEFSERSHLFAETIRTTSPTRRAELIKRIKKVMEADMETIHSKDAQISALISRMETLTARFEKAVVELAQERPARKMKIVSKTA